MPSDSSANGKKQCALCEKPSVDRIPVTNEETGETRDADLCEDHLDKLKRYNRGEEVDWEEDNE